MTTDLDENLRTALSEYAAVTDAVPPPVELIRDRANGQLASRRSVRRRLALIGVPLVGVLGAGVAVATGGSKDVAQEQFTKAHEWNPEWDIPAANAKLVASDTAPDGAQAEYWVGVSATHAPAQCALWLSRLPGRPWQAEGSSCTTSDSPTVGPDSPFTLTMGSAGGDTYHGVLAFHVRRGTQTVAITLDDGSERDVPVTTPGYALVVLPPKRAATKAVALDGAGRVIDTTTVFPDKPQGAPPVTKP
jgi:hypothetical protein